MTLSLRTIGRITADVILKGHIWLGICAVACTAGTYLLLQQDIQVLYICFVFFGTMTIYNLHAFATQNLKTGNSWLSWRALPVYMRIIIPLGLIMTTAIYAVLTLQNKLTLLLPCLLTVLYVLPLLGGKRLKDFAYIKIVLITLVWTMITYGVPVQRIPEWWASAEYSYLLADRMLFFFALAIPFDIRDVYQDQCQNLKTIPNTLGIANSQNLAMLVLLLAAGMLVLGMEELPVSPGLGVLLILVYFFLGILIMRLKKKHSALFYSVMMDGVLFLYGLTILLSLWLGG